MRVKEPEQATLIVELVADINGGGPADEKCTFYGPRASNGNSNDDIYQAHCESKTGGRCAVSA